MRFAPVMGITRVANVTGLDSVGIPVVMVCRPNSRSVSVSQGKGIDLASARASGMMEAVELFHAETITLPLRLCTYEELRYQHNVVPVNQLPRVSNSRFTPNLRLPWCEGRDLISGKDVFVPYEMVHTNYTVPLPDGNGCFVASSNGLASGNVLSEAISHGICEVIERDATTLWRMRATEQLGKGLLDLESVDDPICQMLIGRLERAGFFAAVWDVTSDIAIATFACFIFPRDDRAMWHSSVAVGYGCHPAREIALARALTEAAQARLTVISGLRDDLGPDCYEQLLNPDVITAIRDRVLHCAPTHQFCDVAHYDAEIFEDDIEWQLQSLQKAGIERVIVIDLTKREFGLPVVRVIIPGLEPMPDVNYAPGRRGRGVLKLAP